MAKRIARILSARGGSDERVFAIRSAWGLGKSSLKTPFIEGHAERYADVQVLDFNPLAMGGQ